MASSLHLPFLLLPSSSFFFFLLLPSSSFFFLLLPSSSSSSSSSLLANLSFILLQRGLSARKYQVKLLFLAGARFSSAHIALLLLTSQRQALKSESSTSTPFFVRRCAGMVSTTRVCFAKSVLLLPFFFFSRNNPQHWTRTFFVRI